MAGSAPRARRRYSERHCVGEDGECEKRQEDQCSPLAAGVPHGRGWGWPARKVTSRSSGFQEVTDGVRGALLPLQSLDSPFGDALALLMDESTRLRLVDVLVLSQDNERLLSSCRGVGARKGLVESGESEEVV